MLDLNITGAFQILMIENHVSALSIVKKVGVSKERMRQSLCANNPSMGLLNRYCEPAGFTLSQLIAKAESIPRREVKR